MLSELKEKNSKKRELVSELEPCLFGALHINSEGQREEKSSSKATGQGQPGAAVCVRPGLSCYQPVTKALL